MPKRFVEKKFTRAEKPEKKEKFVNEQQCKFNPCLDEEQTESLNIILNNRITVLTGSAGCGKTHLSCVAAVKLYLNGHVEKIVVSRPNLASEDHGFIPGDIDTKMIPWIRPLQDLLSKVYAKPHIDYLIKNKTIEVIPIQHLRGLNLANAAICVDEVQNCTLHQLKMILTRLDEGSTMILSGDTEQSDFRKKSDSGLVYLTKFNIPEFAVIELKNEHRPKIIIDILKEFKKIGA